jgi:hypothetical protein
MAYANPRTPSPLGTITKTASRTLDVDKTTGEITSVHAGRKARFGLLSAIRDMDPQHRTAQCLWSRISSVAGVQVIKDREFNQARYSGLRVCGRVWTCPVCASKISERRAVELAASVAVARAMDIRVALLTCTIPHIVQDKLPALLRGMSTAWRSFTSDRQAIESRKAIQLVGTIRNTEVTHGKNGWHPHFHALVFYRADVDLRQVEAQWSAHWRHCCVKAGLREPSEQHGLTLQNGDYAAAYVSKWGLEHELTKSMQKTAREHGRTPFDIARDYQAGTDKGTNLDLWRDFTSAFHGKRQLFWSAGLKKLFAVEDVTDEALATSESERPTVLVVELTWPEWRAVRARHRATLLDLAEHNPEGVRWFLDDLMSG